MKKRVLVSTVLALILGGISASTANAGSMCNNGSYSSNSGRGTCSWNGGVDRSFSSFSDPGSSSWKRQNFSTSNGFETRSNRNYRSNSNGWSQWDSWK